MSGSPEELVSIDLTDDQLDVLVGGLIEWGGPAHPTEVLAVAMGFDGIEDLNTQCDRLRRALRERRPLSRWDWTRALLAAEISIASNVLGAGVDWEIVSGWKDAPTFAVLRSLQVRLGRARVLVREELRKQDARLTDRPTAGH